MALKLDKHSISKSEYFETTWKLIEQYFMENRGYQLVKHLIDSYNDFVLRKIEDILEGFNPIEINHHFLPEEQQFMYTLIIEVKNPILSKPTIYEKDGSSKILTPTDARNRNVTYAAPLYIDLLITARSYNVDTKEYSDDSKRIQNVCLGRVPVMVNSRYCVLSTCPTMNTDECRYDFGGYFIINGNEKAVISQDRIAENKTYVFINNKVSTYSHIGEIRSVTENKFSVPKTTSLKLSAKPNQFGRYIRVNIHHIKHDIPLFVLFRALGVESDKEIIGYIIRECDPNYNTLCKELIGSIEEGNNILYTREAREQLVKYMNINGHPKEMMQNKQYKQSVLVSILEKEFLPHVGANFDHKAMYLGYMVNKLLSCYLGILPYDDRDSYINKRVDTPGILMANLFRQYYGKVVKDMRNMIQKDINTGSWKATNKFINVINKVNINKIIKSTIIESGLKFGLATGNWGIKSTKTKQGVAQVLNRMTYSATISHLRRINTPIEKTGKLVQPRKLHATQWGIICPAETPEGVSVGLVKNMSVMSSITIASNSTFLREILKDAEYELIHYSSGKMDIFDNGTKVIINGDIIGVHRSPHILVQKIKNMKQRGIINVYTGVYWSTVKNEICICTEGGRCIRPLYIVKPNNHLAIDSELIEAINKGQAKWNDLVCGQGKVSEPMIEYLDVEECNAAMIAMKPIDLEKGFKGARYPVTYTHLEMDPSLILGVLAGSIPFSDHNQAPRNCYQCLWVEEEVLLADGSRKMIKDVQIGDKVVTFDPISMQPSYTTVVNHYIRETNEQMYELTIYNGKSIKATANHLFMTDKGWVKMEDLRANDNIGIYMNNLKSYSSDDYSGPKLILDKDSEINQTYPSITNLLPIYHDSPTLVFITRISGYLIAKKVTQSGTMFDAKMIYNDLQYSNCDVSYDLFSELYVALGFTSKNVLPAWLEVASSQIKHAFLTGLMSGNQSEDPSVLRIGSKASKDKLNIIIEQIVTLFQHFEIHIEKIETTSTNLLTDKLYKIHLHFKKDQDNFMRLFENIGFVYDQYQLINASMQLFECKKFCGYSMFVPIVSVQPINNKLISDITVESDNHSFITTHGIMTHNSSMGKQAIGIYTSNYRKRFDTMGHILNYPQKPLVSTRIGNLINGDKLPCGMNVIVAIATWTGFNQEDSIIMNKSSVDRGMFISTYYRTYKDQNTKNHSTGEEEFYCCPQAENTKFMKPYNYSKLNMDGFVTENTMVEAGDVIIGKCMPQKQGSVILNKDSSIALKNNEIGFIDKNSYNDNLFTNINGDGYTFSKVRIRSDRVPTIGDKFSSRCYDAETEVLTTKGWVFIKDLTLDHEVASMVGNKLEYLKPKELQEYEYTGKMYRVKSNQVDLLVTPNHRMFVAQRTMNTKKTPFKMEYPEDIFNKIRFYKKNVDVWEPDLTGDVPDQLIIEKNKIIGFKVGQKVYDIDDWIKLNGIWIAEGCADSSRVNIAAHKDRVQVVLNEIEKSMNIVFVKAKYESDDNDNWSWNILDKDIIDYFKPLSVGAINKYLPNWVWFLDREQCRTMIKHMCLGDGHVMKNGTERYDTSSTQLADDFQRLCLHAGWSASKKLKDVKGSTGVIMNKQGKPKEKPQYFKRNADAWRLTIVTTQNEPKVNKNIKADKTNAQDSWEPNPTGKVYCCTVPKGEGVIYVRRNGICHWGSNSGQKGTVGMVYNQYDMPFSTSGISPDIIINPHAIPSRMTIGQLMECVMGKACSVLGTMGDATPFTDITIEDIAKALDKCGIERYGNEVLYNSRTGELIECDIFMGPTYYQRLKHMTADKIHCLTEDHEVLTNAGWIPINELKYSNKIACLQNNKLVYEYPIDVLCFSNYSGKMYCISSDQIDLNVTINHRMYCSLDQGLIKTFGLHTADTVLGKKAMYSKTALNTLPDYQYVFDEKEIRPMESWLLFFGVWVFMRSSTGIKHCSIQLQEKVKKCLFDMDITFTSYEDKIDITNNNFLTHLETYKNLNEVGLPFWVWLLSQHQANILLYGFLITQEHMFDDYEATPHHIDTKNKKLADDISRLCLHAGKSANIVLTNNIYSVIVNQTESTNYPIINDAYGHITNQRETIYEYTGSVYCLQVPSEIFYVRRNGKPVWTGNSRSQNGPVVLLTRQPAEGRARDGGLRLGEMEVECNWAHGTMQFLKERTMDNSDNYRVFVCKKCGCMANVNPEKNIYQCVPCQNNTHFSEVRIPYACKLLFQEIQTMSIGTKIIT